ncbi:MAG TPA: PAS domain S-box protein [Spirochaetota bacterium]|nr:PAS domain S-box protein [Spirochaetota bacterium]HPJ43033.1 PAS domain S-box protein [Spirochaetota bacterium]HPR38660.1 PAS domain S-box protein [Spirochaetota bacterium]
MKRLKNLFSRLQIHKSPGNWIVRFGILFLLGTWLISIQIVFEDRRLELSRAKRETANLSIILERHIYETFSRTEVLLFTLRQRWERGFSKSEMTTFLHNAVTANPELFNLISIIDRHGNVLLTDKSEFKPTYSGDRPFFIHHRENSSRYLRTENPILGRVTGKWYLPLSVRLQNAKGEFNGVLLASVNPYYFSMIFQEVNLGKKSLVYLADFNGTIYSGMLGGKDMGLEKTIPVEIVSGFTDNKHSHPETVHTCIDGIERIFSRAFIKNKTMFVSVGIGLEEWLAPWRSRTLFIIIAQILITLIILIIIFRLRQAIISRDEINEELDQFFSTSLDLLCIADADGNFRRVNKEWENILGYSTGDLEKRSFLDFVHPDDLQETIDKTRESSISPVFNFINRYRCIDGSYRYIEWRSTPHDKLIYAAARDITERIENEKALRDSEERFKALHNASFGGIAIHDKGVILECNRGLEELTGYSRDELIGINGLLLIAEQSRDTVMKNIMSGYEEPYDAIGIRKNGKNFIVRIEAKNIPYKGKTVRVTEFRDITEQKKSEEALRESEEKLKAVFNAANVGFSITDEQGKYVMYNNWWLNYLGYEADELKQKTNLDITHPDDIETSRNYFLKVIAGELSNYRIEKKFIKKDGSTVWGDLAVSPVKDREGRVQLMVGIVNDITDRKYSEEEREKLQAQLNQSQKMESVGRLAGGVAHDFNNMLGAIFGYTELSLRKIAPDHPVYTYLQDIKKAAERSANLTRQLLAFARKQTVAPKILDLNETVEGMLKMLRQIIGEDISLEWLPSANPVMIKMDPAQVDQLLVNLCVNARDAITDTGKVTIETDKTVFTEADKIKDESILPGDYVVLVISDNGIGMDRETLDHLFEPFFTTKETGRGTGLGLATVYGIVKQNNGFINVYSEPGLGTTFRIYLPQHYAAAVSKEQESGTKEPDQGHQTLLLVEDEAMLLNINSEILEQLGYTVLTAASPAEALRIAGQHSGHIDLLITDVIMPEMNGRDLADKISVLHPGIRLLFMSGYTASVIAHHGVLEDGVHFLQKPFSLNDLAEKVKETLGK